LRQKNSKTIIPSIFINYINCISFNKPELKKISKGKKCTWALFFFSKSLKSCLWLHFQVKESDYWYFSQASHTTKNKFYRLQKTFIWNIKQSCWLICPQNCLTVQQLTSNARRKTLRTSLHVVWFGRAQKWCKGEVTLWVEGHCWWGGKALGWKNNETFKLMIRLFNGVYIKELFLCKFAIPLRGQLETFQITYVPYILAYKSLRLYVGWHFQGYFGGICNWRPISRYMYHFLPQLVNNFRSMFCCLYWLQIKIF
jgi:hypothetical protein